jgi:hypothetical protein
MTNVLDREEILSEIQELPTYKKTQPLSPGHGFVRKLTAVLKGIRHSKRTDVHMTCQAAWEMPIDTLARKYPYMYADALLG